MATREYRPEEIELKWQQRWEEDGVYCVEMDPSKPKYYVLDMFPYPSGSGLHVGHVEGYTATDILARFKRARGYCVMHPMGWDAFGLPAEQHAIKTGTHPRETTESNIANFKRQLKRLGFGYDWSREINTTYPDYYRWTQWIFLKLYDMGLAYIAEVPVNWCPALGTVLANEEVIDGKSEIGGFPVVRRPMRQWMLKITAYADRLIEDLDLVDWPDYLKDMQRNWIGRSKGAEVDFPVDPKCLDSTLAPSAQPSIRVFTTRPDTLFGATYMVLAPEHPLVDAITQSEQRADVQAYREMAVNKSELQRTELQKEKTGVFTGAYAINPVNKARIPIWIADYVLASYGTGAIMCVPAHDTRDWEFAQKYDLPIVEVVSGGDTDQAAYTGDGQLVNSDFLNTLNVPQAKAKMTAWLEEHKEGRETINYKLRDWLFSRQRYWGEPFPIVHLEDGQAVALPEEHLPLKLPEVERYEPSGTGESPLATIDEWVETEDPRSGKPALRETNTMPQWAGSCWYYLRYLDPDNDQVLVDPEKEAYWMPVDTYVGGAEHAVLHLLYARFWHKVLYDCGVVSTAEPFQRVINQGMILGKTYLYYVPQDHDPVSYHQRHAFPETAGDDVHPDYVRVVAPIDVRWQGETPFHPQFDIELEEVIEKMSKSRGNVVNPDDVIAEYGADSLRLYEMFLGPVEQDKPWEDRGITGVHRFLTRVWRLVYSEDGLIDEPVGEDLLKALHRTIKRVTEESEALRFNTAIAAMMEFTNLLYKEPSVPKEVLSTLTVMLAPYAPHMAQELWSDLGQTGYVADARWPEFDEELLREETIEIAVQVMGKVRGTIDIAPHADEDSAVQAAKENENVQRFLQGKTIRKVVYVPGRILNFVAN